MIDKAFAIPNTGVNGATLRSMGAKPIRFDDKTIVVKYRPTVVADVAANTPVAGAEARVITSPWLSTGITALTGSWSPSQVLHNGLWFGLEVDSGIPGDGDYQFGLECEVQFEFRKPLLTLAPGAPPAISLTQLPRD